MNWLQKQIYTVVQKAATVANNELFRAQYYGLSNGQGIVVNDDKEDYVEKGFSANAQLYAIVSMIAEKSAGIPYRVVVQNDKGEFEDAEGAEADALRELLYTPNGYQTCREFIEQSVGMLLVTGDLYWYAPRLESGVNKGRTTEMHVAPSQYMEIVSGGWMEPIKGYRIKKGNYSRFFEYEDVMHVKKVNLDYRMGQEFYGMSPLKPGRDLLGKANEAQKAQRFLYENRGAAGFVTGTGKTPFTEQQAQAMRDTWKKKYGRAGATGEPVFTEADVKWQNIVMSSRDLGFNEDHIQVLRDFCAMYHVPSSLFGDSANKTYSNYAEARKAFYTDAVQPVIESVYDEFTRWMVPNYTEGIKVVPDYSKVSELQPDKKQAAEVMSIGRQNGAVTANEFRAAIGLPHVDDPAADVLYQGVGLTPLAEDTLEDMDEVAKTLERMGIRSHLE